MLSLPNIPGPLQPAPMTFLSILPVFIAVILVALLPEMQYAFPMCL